MDILASIRGIFAKPSEPAKPLKMDSWSNGYTGFGTERDKTTYGIFCRTIRITDMELSALYHGDDVAARIVEARPKEMFRRGYELAVCGDEGDEADSGDLEDELEEYAKDLQVNERLKEGMIWGRLWGGSLVIIGAIDGLTMDKPLNERAIRTVAFVNVVDRRFVYVSSYYADPLSPKYGQPEVYAIVNSLGGGSQRATAFVHETRCIRFDGAPTDVLERRALAGWTYSVLQRPYNVMRDFAAGFQGASQLLTDASQGVFKMQGLIDMIGSGETGALATRMALVDMTRSAARSLLLDAETESFERTPTSFAGLPDMLDRFMMRLAAAAEMPVTILMGRSAAGMNATGESDFRAWYDVIGSEQENDLKPKLLRVYRILALAKDSPAAGADLDLEIRFRALWSPSDKEQADVEKTYADRDVAYINAGVLVPEEVALSRFANGKFSPDTKIDVDARKASLADAVKFDPYKNEQEPEQPAPDPNGAPGEPETTAAPPPGPSAASK